MKTKLLLTFTALCLAILTMAQIQVGADIDGEAADDDSGSAVSMPDANTVAIGAIQYAKSDNNAGQVRIFSWSGSAWVQKGTDIDGEAAYDKSGYSVSMPDANPVAIGAPYNDASGTYAGHVRIYSWNGSWVQKGTDIDGESAEDLSGRSVSMPDANTVAIGASENDGNGVDAGHVRIYSWNGSIWMQKGTDIDGETAGDYSGYSVSMPDANTVAIGAIGNDENGDFAGHVRMYEWNGTSWIQKGTHIDDESAEDLSGYCVSMPDANTVGIGAPELNGNGNNDGHARIYSWNGSTWVQKGTDIVGEAADDWSGYAVSMPDINTVAIGAPGNNSLTGHVRVYSLSSVGINDNKKVENHIMAYPNPATDYISFDLEANANEATVELFDLQGRLVSRKAVSAKTKIDVGHLDEGLYMYKLIQNDNSFSDKVIIE